VDTSGCHPLHSFFTDQSTNATIWNWDFGNGFTDVVQNPNEFFFNLTNNDTVYHVELISSNVFGCRDTAYQDILVFAIPNANFTATPVNQTFPNTTVSINNASTLGSWNYDWNFGDASTDIGYNPADHSYSTWGNYTIELIVSSAFCSDTSTQDITIIAPLPIPEVYGSGYGCRPVTIQFTDSSQYVDSYYWDFGDGGFSTLPNPYYTYHQAGVYDITLTVTGPGGVTQLILIDSVEVYEYANAFFQHAPTNVYVPTEPVQFYNLSSFANNYLWDFGDGNTSTAENPEHFYSTAGTYDVTLIANNDNNCPDTIKVTNAVFAETGGTIDFPNAFTPNTSGSNGGYYDPNAVDNDIFFPVFKGVEEYHLMIFNRWGEMIFESFDEAKGWDGYYRDVLCQQDVYIWKAKVKFTNGNEESFVGEIHLIR
jgi:gliding motility-associated-like protein